jgi:hypothetical protein
MVPLYICAVEVPGLFLHLNKTFKLRLWKKSYFLWLVAPCTSVNFKRSFVRTCRSCAFFFLASLCSLVWLIILPWRWRRYVPPKGLLTFTGLHGVLSEKVRKVSNNRCENLNCCVRFLTLTCLTTSVGRILEKVTVFSLHFVLAIRSRIYNLCHVL